MPIDKNVSYTSVNSYSSLNRITEKTKNIWIACHGLGYLSRYFIKYFKDFDADENYIIAPQAPSKYYQNSEFKHVGASWLTKEETEQETENVLNYLDAVYKAEQIPPHCNLIVMGYSQGVSVAMRWVAKRKIKCNTLIIHSGGIPKELQQSDFDFLNENTKIYNIYGTEDPYINKERIVYESGRAEELFGSGVTVVPFQGGHIVSVETLMQIARQEI